MIAEHLVAKLAELDEEPGLCRGRRGVALLLVEVPRRLVVVGRIHRDDAKRLQGRQMRRIEVEGHLVAVLCRGAIA